MRSLWPHGGLWRHRDFLKLWSAETISAVRLPDRTARAPARRDPRARRQRLRGRCARDRAVPPVHHLHAAGRRLGRPASAPTDPHRRRLRAGRAPRDDPHRVRRRCCCPSRSSSSSHSWSVLSRSSSTSRTSRTCRRSSSATDHRRATRSSRSAARPPRSAVPASAACSSQILTAPYAVLLDAVSFVGSGLFMLRIRKDEPRPERSTVQRPEAEPVDGAQGGAALRARKPEPPRAGGLHGDVEPLRERRVLDHPRVRRARARALGRRDRDHLLGRGRRLARRSLHGHPHLGPIRDRPDIDRRGGALRHRRRFSWPSRRPETRRFPSSSSPQLLFGFTVVVYNIVQVSYRQAICPPRLQGRMNSVMRFMVWGTIPIGTLLGGALATWIGLRETIVVGAVGGGLVLPVAPPLAAATPARDAGADRRRRSRARSRLTFGFMPELPEVEAWVRELDPLVSRAPIEKAGPAHIATLKTFDPPLAALDGRQLAGARRRGKNLLFPIAGRGSRPACSPDERRASALPARRGKASEDADVPSALHGRRRARSHRGGEEEARRRVAR